MKLVQGKSGYGGLIGDLYKATSGGGDPTKVLGAVSWGRGNHGPAVRNGRGIPARQGLRGRQLRRYPRFHDRSRQAAARTPFREHAADQGPRLETLRALDREIDLLGQSYGLEKKNSSLTGQEDRLKEVAKSSGVTEELRQQVARAQEGELTGLARINAAHQERLRHLKEEGELNGINLKLAGQIRDAEIARFEKEEQRKTAAAVLGANTSLGEAGNSIKLHDLPGQPEGERRGVRRSGHQRRVRQPPWRSRRSNSMLPASTSSNCARDERHGRRDSARPDRGDEELRTDCDGRGDEEASRVDRPGQTAAGRRIQKPPVRTTTTPASSAMPRRASRIAGSATRCSVRLRWPRRSG